MASDSLLDTLADETKISLEEFQSIIYAFSPGVSRDCLHAFQILASINTYISETKSWQFALLSRHDFFKDYSEKSNASVFDLKISSLTGKRSKEMLSEIRHWNINHLKIAVSRLLSYTDDASTVLTTLVLRIISKYSVLEFSLQSAISRATLIRLNHELSDLVTFIESEKTKQSVQEDQAAAYNKARSQYHMKSTISMWSDVLFGAPSPPKTDMAKHAPGSSKSSSSSSSSPSSDTSPLLASYRAFATQLLKEMETAPQEIVEDELFQVVYDLERMFYKFAKSIREGNTNFDNLSNSPSVSYTTSTTKSSPTATGISYGQSYEDYDEEFTSDDYDSEEDDNEHDLGDILLSPPMTPKSAFDSIPEKTTNGVANASLGYLLSATKSASSMHQKNAPSMASSAASFSSTSSFRSTSTTNTSASISEEIPNLMSAFDLAIINERIENQKNERHFYTKQPVSTTPMPSTRPAPSSTTDTVRSFTDTRTTQTGSASTSSNKTISALVMAATNATSSDASGPSANIPIYQQLASSSTTKFPHRPITPGHLAPSSFQNTEGSVSSPSLTSPKSVSEPDFPMPSSFSGLLSTKSTKSIKPTQPETKVIDNHLMINTDSGYVDMNRWFSAINHVSHSPPLPVLSSSLPFSLSSDNLYDSNTNTLRPIKLNISQKALMPVPPSGDSNDENSNTTPVEAHNQKSTIITNNQNAKHTTINSVVINQEGKNLNSSSAMAIKSFGSGPSVYSRIAGLGSMKNNNNNSMLTPSASTIIPTPTLEQKLALPATVNKSLNNDFNNNKTANILAASNWKNNLELQSNFTKNYTHEMDNFVLD